DTEVRDLLLDELRHDPEFGSERLRRVAELLLAHANRELAQPQDSETRWFLLAQEGTGLAYTAPSPAGGELASALGQGLGAGTQPDALRVARVTQALAAPLVGEEKVLLYAAGVERWAAGRADSAARFFEDLGSLDEVTTVGTVRLPSPG